MPPLRREVEIPVHAGARAQLLVGLASCLFGLAMFLGSALALLAADQTRELVTAVQRTAGTAADLTARLTLRAERELIRAAYDAAAAEERTQADAELALRVLSMPEPEPTFCGGFGCRWRGVGDRRVLVEECSSADPYCGIRCVDEYLGEAAVEDLTHAVLARHSGRACSKARARAKEARRRTGVRVRLVCD